MKLWMLVLLMHGLIFGMMAQGLAQEQPSMTQELENFPAIMLKHMDNPREQFAPIKKHWRELDPVASPVAWIRAHWVAAKHIALSELATPEQIKQVQTAAFERHMFLEWADIVYFGIENGNHPDDAFELKKGLYGKFIHDLRETKDSNALALGLAYYAEFLLVNGALDQSLPIIDEANRLLNDNKNSLLIVYDYVKYVFALSMRYQGQLEASIAIQVEIDEIYKKMKLRSARSANLYDLCLTMVDHYRAGGLKTSLQTIESYFLEAIRLGKEIGDRYLVAKNQYALSSLKTILNQHEEALTLAKTALDYFASSLDQDWFSRGHRNYARALIQVGRYQESIPHLDLAEKATSQANKVGQMEISDLRYKALRELGHKDQAMKTLEKSYALFKSIAKEREDKTFNQAAAKLGLQYEAERNKTLAQQNDLQSQQIGLLKKFRVVSLLAASLSLLVFGVLFVVWRQASVIRNSRREMKDVLDNIDEGIAILDRNLLVRSGYSPFLDKIFGTNPTALTEVALLDRLFAPNTPMAERGVIAREALQACIGEGALSWELNSSHLPHEITLGESILQLHWQPLYNAQEQMSRILLTIRDFTSIRAIETRMANESQRIQMLEKKLAEVLAGKTVIIRSLLKDLSAEWALVQDQIFVSRQEALALRRLHTWKGASRTLGLKLLASSLHEMETCLLAIPPVPSVIKEEQWRSLTLSFQDYQHLLDTILVSHQTGAAADSDLYALAGLYAHEMKRRLDQVGCLQEGLLVLDHVQDWPDGILPRVHEILLHAVANAVDHGFLRPFQAQKKLAKALVQIRARRVNQDIELLILDNGSGINWLRLRQKAESIGFQPTVGQSYAELLFMDGVSTADTTSETSGRGVGLSAVRDICQQLGGHIVLEDAEGGGTALRLTFPWQQIRLAQSS